MFAIVVVAMQYTFSVFFVNFYNLSNDGNVGCIHEVEMAKREAEFERNKNCNGNDF